MTREEARHEIDSLDFYLQNHTDDYSEESHAAMVMAIKALEQKTCEDAISRRAVLDTLDKMDSVLDEDRTVETYKKLLTACYNDLPSVTPIHKDRTDLKHPLLAEYKVESEEK